MNDDREISFGISCVYKVAEFYKKCGVYSLIERIIDRFNSELQIYGYYIASGSHNYSNLHLFNSYPGRGKPGSGVAIAFDHRKILVKGLFSVPIIGNVQYGELAYHDILIKCFDNYLHLYNLFIKEQRTQVYFDSLLNAYWDIF